MPKKIVIIDYGSGNLQSVLNALQQVKKADEQALISSNHLDLQSATHIILPGVGAFNDCINGLKAIPAMIDELKNQVLERKKPFLGICVGMQLLADVGYEYGTTPGLGFIKGQVVKIDNHNNQLKVPHVGWNNLDLKANHPILQGIESGDHAYFVHSYHFITDDENNVLATTNYGQKINAILVKENIIATQFHPEKSSGTGLKLLENFIK